MVVIEFLVGIKNQNWKVQQIRVQSFLIIINVLSFMKSDFKV